MRKKTIITLSTIVVIALAILLLLLKSNTAETKKTVSVPDSLYLTVGVLPISECLPLIVAEHSGISESLGLHLRTIMFDSAMDADTAFTNRQTDLTVTDGIKLALMLQNGDRVSGILCGDYNLTLVTTRASRITKPKNLKEKIIGITRNSVTDWYADLVMEKEKMETVDLNRPQINSLYIRYRMIEQNEYDGAILPHPWSQAAISLGNNAISLSSEFKELNNSFIIAAHDSVLSARKNDIDKLKKTYNQAVDSINSWKKPLQLILHKYYSQIPLPKDTIKVSNEDRLHHYTPYNIDSLQSARNWARKRGLTEKPKENPGYKSIKQNTQ